MAVKKINTIHVPEELAILKTPCISIEGNLGDHEQLMQDLADTANANPGCVGLSANQIWDNPTVPPPAMFILPGAEAGKWALCINPKIENVWKKTIKGPDE